MSSIYRRRSVFSAPYAEETAFLVRKSEIKKQSFILWEITLMGKRLPTGKASGPDRGTNEVLKPTVQKRL